MRRINKKKDSSIISKGLTYGTKSHRSEIAAILLKEQNRICAYTEEYFGRADKAEVEHFNPTLKSTSADSYDNWFLVKAQWNNEKGSIPRWSRHQPLMHPTDLNFENRLIYKGGEYILADNDDIEARNIRSFLKLDDEELTKKRIMYIKRMRHDMKLAGMEHQEFIDFRLELDRSDIYYIRAIEEEFNVKVNFDLLTSNDESNS